MVLSRGSFRAHNEGSFEAASENRALCGSSSRGVCGLGPDSRGLGAPGAAGPRDFGALRDLVAVDPGRFAGHFAVGNGAFAAFRCPCAQRGLCLFWESGGLFCRRCIFDCGRDA